MRAERVKYYDKYRKKKRFFRKFWLVLLLVFAIGGIVYFAPFFKIAHVEITAGEKTHEQAVAYGETLKGKNINWASTKNMEKTMSKWLYTKNVEVKRTFFNRIRIKIDERIPAFAIFIDQYYIIDASGIILEIQEANDNSVAELRGLPSINPKIGEPFNDVSSPMFGTFQAVMVALNKKPQLGAVGYLDLLDLSNIKFRLDDLNIILGGLNDIDYKLQMLAEAKNQLAARPRGSMDLSVVGKAYYVAD